MTTETTGSEHEEDAEAEEDARHPRTLRRFVEEAFDAYQREAGAFDAGEAYVRREMALRRRKAVLGAVAELVSLRERSPTTAPRGRPGGRGRPARDPVDVAEDAGKARAALLEAVRVLGMPPFQKGAPLSQIARGVVARLKSERA